MKRFAITLSVPFHSLLLLLLSSCGSYVHYQVKPGDSLYSIGFKHEVDYKTLAEWNDIPPPYVIHEGQWLRVVSPLQEDEQQNTEVDEKLNDVQRIKQRIVKRPKPSPKTTQRGRTNNKPSIPTKSVSEQHVDSGVDWVWPTKGKVTKYFSQNSQGKKGIDISGKRGQIVVAAAEGIVVYSGSGIIGLGNLVIIKHNKTYLSAYAHNDSLLVNEGQQVKQGQQIAKMGDTGTERVLLHFEIRKNGKPVNPLQYLAENNP